MGTSTMSPPVESVAVDDKGDTSASVSPVASVFKDLSSLISEDDTLTFSTVVKLTNYVEKRVKACISSATGCYLLITRVPNNIEETLDSLLLRRGIRNQIRMTHELSPPLALMGPSTIETKTPEPKPKGFLMSVE